MEPAAPKKRSPWLYVGIGCGALLLLSIVAVVVAVTFMFKKGEEYAADLSNPITRTAMVKKTLGANTLPDGYFAVMSLSVPAIMDMAVLSSRSPDAPTVGPKEEVRVFVYMFLKMSSASDQQKLRQYVEGKSDDTSVLARNGVHVGQGEIIGRGIVPLSDGRRVLYVTQRGELSAQNQKSTDHGLNSVLFLECPGQTQLRMAFWMGADPDPEAPLESLDLEGTPVDPEAIRTFMSPLNPCKES